MRLASVLPSLSINRNKKSAYQQNQIRFGKTGTFIEKVLKRESKEKILFENRHAAIMPNIDPSRPGQILIVSKRPVEQLKELSETETGDVFRLVTQYQNFWEGLNKNKGKTYSYSIFINDGKYSGQSVPHFHVQLVPIESAKPLPEGLLRSAIDPNKKGLPKTPAQWDERINTVYKPFHAVASEIQKFSTQEGLKTSFTATA
jgi:bis(5'-adenosyl)-triphosphatase